MWLLMGFHCQPASPPFTTSVFTPWRPLCTARDALPAAPCTAPLLVLPSDHIHTHHQHHTTHNTQAPKHACTRLRTHTWFLSSQLLTGFVLAAAAAVDLLRSGSCMLSGKPAAPTALFSSGLRRCCLCICCWWRWCRRLLSCCCCCWCAACCLSMALSTCSFGVITLQPHPHQGQLHMTTPAAAPTTAAAVVAAATRRWGVRGSGRSEGAAGLC